ncbi:hypothetical protein OJF2_72570 [Aquisphaera giovannonii]|uniref:Peptidase C-terminal archaeal/bacterial domain-containing protein n=1 Tax=Aquisphaera giovannonii TaxID=406548 RepID=A0A5B9WFB4_9BACT|nr:hypothetical protein [Aquisphaera giovannonii]QEH38651.1 hypothetical protein OJF2_72570 [Aquisphaera giovannonii]
MAGPIVTAGTAGNVIASGPLAAGGTATATVDLSTGGAFGGDIALRVTTGSSVAATNGCRLDVFPQGDAGGAYDTVAAATYPFSGLSASSTYQKTLRLPTGVYKVVATNLDATNAITVQVTSSRIA